MPSLLAGMTWMQMGGNDVCQTLPTSHSLMWKNVVYLAPHFYPHSCFGLGSGSRIRFWEDL